MLLEFVERNTMNYKYNQTLISTHTQSDQVRSSYERNLSSYERNLYISISQCYIIQMQGQCIIASWRLNWFV